MDILDVLHERFSDERVDAAVVRLWRRVERGPGCWTWSGSHSADGYARWCVGPYDGAPVYHLRCHRLIYELVRGPIPDHLVTDHLCRNRACVNPWHLELVTPGENTSRGNHFSAVNARKVRCPRGHEYDGVSREGWRYCSICRNELSAIRSRKRKRAS